MKSQLSNPEPSSNSHLIIQPPMGRKRWFTTILIALTLVLHVVIPFRVYFGVNEYDERFAWRFFSSVAMRKYEVSVEETYDDDIQPDSLPVPLASIFELGSMKIFLKKHEPEIVHSFLRWRIQQHPAIKQIRYECTGFKPDGTALKPVQISIDGETGTIESLTTEP